jgi:hypothetical protein
MKKHLIPGLLLLAALSSCIYDYTPDYQGVSGFLVVEGDVIIGEVCEFRVFPSTTLDDDAVMTTTGYPVSARVETDNGKTYGSGTSTVDLTDADLSRSYRLLLDVSLPTGGTAHYATPFQPVQVAPAIDSVTYQIDGSQMDIRVSTHSDGEKGYYHWKASETWEYHTDYYATHYYEPEHRLPDGSFVAGEVYPYENGENTYYCWDSDLRSEIMVGSTLDLVEDKIVNHQLYSLGDHERKVSYIYSVEIEQSRLSPEGYRYMQNVSRNTTDVGGLFSPEPSEMRGNIVNVNDSTDVLIGFVNVTTVSRKRIFILNSETHFSRLRIEGFDPLIPIRRDWSKTYKNGYLVTVPQLDEKTGLETGLYEWQPARCVDCRKLGGNKERPSYWINQDL